MKKTIENYLINQKEHLNSLNNLFSTNSELNKVSELIANSFSASKTNIIHLNNQLSTFEASYNLAEIELLKEKLANNRDIEDNSNQLFLKVNKKNQAETALLIKTYDDLIKKTDNIIKDLESDKLKQLNDTRNRYSLSLLKLNQENNLVDADLNTKKKHYLSKTKELNNTYQKELADLTSNYNNHLSSFNTLEDQIIKRTNYLIEDLENEYSNFSDNHKEKILNNKQNYYNTTELINDKIIEINKNYKVLIDSNQGKLKNSLNNLDKDNDEFLKHLQIENRDVLDDFENNLTNIDSKYDEIKKVFEDKENLLNAIYNKDITSINVLFQQEKNEYNKKLNELLKEYENHKNQNVTLNSDYQRSFLNYRKQIENSLKILENITKAKRTERKKIYFKDKYHLNKYYLKRLALYRSLRFIKDEKKNASLIYAKRKQEIFNNYYKTVKEQLEKLHNSEKEIIESKQAIEISPLDSQLSNARLLHFSESNLLSLEQTFKRDSFLNSKSTILYQSHLDLLSLKLESTLLEHNYQYEVDNLKGNVYLDVQYQKNVYDGIVKEELITKQINHSVNELKSLSRKHQDDLFIIETNSKIDKETAKLNVALENKKVKESLLQQQLVYETEKLKLNKQKDLNAYVALENIKNSALENDYHQKIVKTYFQMLTNFFDERKIILDSITKTALIDDFLLSKSLIIFSEILQNQIEISEQILINLIIILTKQIEEKISAHKLSDYDQQYKQILDKHDFNKIKTEKAIKTLNKKISDLRNNTLLTYQLITKLEIEINEKEDLKKLIINQIRALRVNLDAQALKTIKQLRKQIKTTKEDILATKLLITKAKQTIKDNNGELDSLNSSLKPLSFSFNNLEKQKEKQIQELDLQHAKDTLPLLSTIRNLTDTFNQFKKINTSLQTEYNSIAHTFVSTKDAVIIKQITYLFNAFDENVNNTYQSLSLLLEHLYTYNKKEQLRIEQEFTNNYQLSLSFLAKKYDKTVKNSENHLKDLTTYLNALLESMDRNLVKNLQVAQKLHKDKYKKASYYIKSLRDHKKEVSDNNKNLLDAFSLNHHDVIKVNKRKHLLKLKETKKDVNAEIKQIQNQIKKNIQEATSKNNAHQQLIKNSNDKQKRNKISLTNTLKKRNLLHQKRIITNNEEVKQITSKIEKAPNKRDLRITYSKKFLISYQQRKVKKVKKALRKDITKTTKQFKKSLKQTL